MYTVQYVYITESARAGRSDNRTFDGRRVTNHDITFSREVSASIDLITGTSTYSMTRSNGGLQQLSSTGYR